MVKFMKIAATAASLVVLAGCASTQSQRLAPDEAPVVMGSRVRSNVTPLQGAFPCMVGKIAALGKAPVAIAVGDVKDYTGKYSQAEGSAITQGGALMVYSALGKLGDSILLTERFDTRIAELELAYIDRRQLGDGQPHELRDANGASVVPWVPYFGGSILRSDYYIIGGITELNYNIQSGGFEVAVNGTGVKRRTYTMNIGVDLRIVETKSMRVMKTVSLQKQITGYEVGGGTFRFFGSDLFDIDIGAKNQEPLQLGVRTVLEQGTLELVGAVTGAFAPICIYEASYSPAMREARARHDAEVAAAGPAAVTTQPAPVAVTATPAVAATALPPATDAEAVNAISSAPLQPVNGQGRSSAEFQVAFDFGGDSLTGRSLATVEQISAAAAQGEAVDFQVIASDSESWSPQKRQDITNTRIRAITDALVQRGVQRSRIAVTWTPSLSDTGITRDGAGYQIFAKLRISKP